MICVQPPCRQENQGAGSKNTCPLVRYLGENTGVMTDPPPNFPRQQTLILILAKG